MVHGSDRRDTLDGDVLALLLQILMVDSMMSPGGSCISTKLITEMRKSVGIIPSRRRVM